MVLFDVELGVKIDYSVPDKRFDFWPSNFDRTTLGMNHKGFI